jgi:pimeloyl-ACP methyl ester carboxylesterase
MRVDKPGVGDSEGNCATTGFDAEVDGYRAAFQALRELDFVDPDALAVVGASMGGAIAPLVAQGQRLKAVAVWGTFARTWFEHLVTQERRRLSLAGNPPAVVTERLRGLSEIHARILFDGLRPRDVLASRPNLAALWYGEPDGLYGRPAAFHQQAQLANIVAAWEKVDAPVLAVHGEYDWVMDRTDHELIAEVVNRLRPGTARFVSIPRTDHNFISFESPEKAFRGEAGIYKTEATETIVNFIRTHLAPDGEKRAPSTAVSTARQGGANMNLFGQFVGDWDVKVTYHAPGGKRSEATGTWTFGWALEGRAIQDVWRVATPTQNPLGYGTTVRFYDPKIDAWRVTWHGLLNGTVYRFLARQQGSEIVMEGQEPGERARWIFYEIQADSFRWRAVTSSDGGQSWSTEQEMEVRRSPRGDGSGKPR